MAYDPYGQEQEQYNPKSIVGSLLNPVTFVASRYKYDPSVYSATKGLWTPFGGKDDIVAGYKSIKEAFGKNFWSGMGQTTKEVWNFGPLGKDHRVKWTSSEYAKKHKRSLYKILIKQRKEMKEALAAADKLKPVVTAAEQQLIVIPQSKTPFGHTLGKARMKVFGDKLVGGALKFGRIYAGVNTAFLLWDITKMVGEPIGRYVVDNINRVSDAYVNRFNPETGGNLALGYLSAGAATERQRAVDAISRSYINGRSALGTEAQLLHS